MVKVLCCWRAFENIVIFHWKPKFDLAFSSKSLGKGYTQMQSYSYIYFFKKVLIIYGNLSSRVTGYCCRMRNQKMVVVTIKAKARKPKLTKEKKVIFKKDSSNTIYTKIQIWFLSRPESFRETYTSAITHPCQLVIVLTLTPAEITQVFSTDEETNLETNGQRLM